MTKRKLNVSWRLGVAAAMLSMAGAVGAAEFTLTAQEFDKVMPDGSVVRMWGYALPGGTPSVPGPTLRVPAGESLTIHVTNGLPQVINGGTVPTSLVVPGQSGNLAPVMVNDSSGRSRVRSFAAEAPSTQTVDYNWAAPKVGTFLYHSGTNPAVQVQMGLYGAVIVEADTNLAYPGVPYSTELTLIYSEVDPALHAAVANGSYGNPPSASVPNPVTSTIDYLPKYFLVNGESFVAGSTLPLATAAAGSPTLLRLLNAGLQTRVPVLQGLDMKLVAEDGNPYQYPRMQYSVLLPALKTMDAVIVPSADGEFPLYDRRLALANNGSAPGGMFRVLRTGGAPIAQTDTYTTDEDTVLNVAAPGVLANDFSPGGALSASVATNPVNGVLALAADGSFTYTPNANYYGTDSFTYTATVGATSAVGTVTITIAAVNDPPIAGPDEYFVPANAASVLDVTINDVDPEGSPITLHSVDNPSVAGGSVQISGNTVTYTPPTGFTGKDSFVYFISDAQGSLGSATVTLTVQ